MAKKRTEPSKKRKATPAEQASKAGNGGVVPPAEHRWQPGQSGNPEGRPPSAGATIREHMNDLAAAGLNEAQLRAVAKDKAEPFPRRAAAERCLRMIEAGDLADFEPVLDGTFSLADLRANGVNTEVVKKIKQKRRDLPNGETETEREIELHDRGGDDFDRVMDRTEGKATQRTDITSNGQTVKQFVNVNVDAV